MQDASGDYWYMGFDTQSGAASGYWALPLVLLLQTKHILYMHLMSTGVCLLLKHVGVLAIACARHCIPHALAIP
jgi:hypothetical protein